MLPHRKQSIRETTREQEQAWFEAHGVTRLVLVRAIESAQFYRQACKDNDPVGLPGVMFWARGNTSLRDQLQGEHKWKPSDAGNVPRIVSADGTHAITFSQGNDATGNGHRMPSTKHPRGVMTGAAVFSNDRYLFPPPTEPTEAFMPACANYILLAARFGHEFRFELSMPIKMEGGQITDWQPRIYYDPLPIASTNDPGDDTDDDGFDVPVARRK